MNIQRKKSRLSFRYIKFVDWILIINIVCIVIFSLIAIANATASPFTGEEQNLSQYLEKINIKYVVLQLIWFGVGLLAMFFMMLPDYHNLGDYTAWIYWINIALLVIVLLTSNSIRGMTGWFSFGDRGFQPSEVAKIAIILTLAKMVSDKTKDKEGITKFKDIVWIVLSFLLPFALILAQPDFGTAFVFAAIFFGMLFMAKTSIKIIASILAVGLIMIPFMWFVVMNDDQKTAHHLLFQSRHQRFHAGQPGQGGYRLWAADGQRLFCRRRFGQAGLCTRRPYRFYIFRHHRAHRLYRRAFTDTALFCADIPHAVFGHESQG